MKTSFSPGSVGGSRETRGHSGFLHKLAAGGDIRPSIAAVKQRESRDWKSRMSPFSHSPSYCLGPSIYDGSGQSCEDVDIPCRDRLGDMCEMIHSLPGVTTAFKKCMKGRCACGGSVHDRLQISCAPPDDCGPCSVWGGFAAGCNLGGSQIWYCQTDPTLCRCANTVFHEMSHACGTMHTMEYWQTGMCVPGDEPCRIGYWFEDQCEYLFGRLGDINNGNSGK